LREVHTCRYCFYLLADFWVFRPAGATCGTDQGEIWQGGADHSSVPNFTLIGLGLWVYGLKNLKKRNFANIIAPKGRIPFTILAKFTGFMLILSVHN